MRLQTDSGELPELPVDLPHTETIHNVWICLQTPAVQHRAICRSWVCLHDSSGGHAQSTHNHEKQCIVAWVGVHGKTMPWWTVTTCAFMYATYTVYHKDLKVQGTRELEQPSHYESLLRPYSNHTDAVICVGLRHDRCHGDFTWKCFESQLIPSSPTIAAVLPHTNIGLPVTNV